MSDLIAVVQARSPLLAALPILLVLGLMLGARWGGQRAGLAGWLAGAIVGALAFGLTPEVLWVSQARGLLISLVVLWVLWPALILYNLVDEAGGIDALGRALEALVRNPGLLLVIIA